MSPKSPCTRKKGAKQIVLKEKHAKLSFFIKFKDFMSCNNFLE